MSSPYATGGGGVTLERRVAALYLARLLTGDTTPELGSDRRVVGVAFQQEPKTAVDDLVIHAARPGEDDPSLQLAIAVRRRPSVVASNTDMKALVTDLVRALDQAADDDTCKHRLAIATGGLRTHAGQLAQLAAHARDHRDATEFFNLIEEPKRVEQALRDRLGHVTALVKEALAEVDGIAEPGTELVRERTWQLLNRLYIVQPRVEEPDTNDWADAQNRLTVVARGRDLYGAGRLLDRLESLAGQYAPAAATVDAKMLRRDVHALLECGVSRSHRGWQVLERLDATARAHVRDRVGAGWMLDRGAEADQLLARADAVPALLVVGESGVGKSALALAAVQRARAAGGEAICVNLRELPESWAQFEPLLGAQLAELLGQMSAPSRYFVVDAADAAAETRREMFLYLVDAAVRGGVQLIAVSSDDVRAIVAEIMENRIGEPPGAFDVAPLNDGALTELVRAFPHLERLAFSPRSRELLRRLVVADLLVRSGTEDVPLSVGDAMHVVWDGLVRRREQRDRGLPDAREQAMMRLARYEFAGKPVGDLDPAAVDGLRRDGLLRTGGEPWQLAPEFAHDELRRYAVARVLVAEDAVGAAVLAAGAPRWALSAATLAVQLQLARGAASGANVAERFRELQASFDAVAAAGHGERWADVPAEALLALADPGPALAGAWPILREGNHQALRRLLRVERRRHASDATAHLGAVPIVELLVGEPAPWWISEDAAYMLGGWLLALVRTGAPAGHPLRLRLQDRLVEAVEAGEERLAQARAEAEAARANPTPEQLERARAIAEARRSLPTVLGVGRRRRERPELPGELTHETVVELLALLGPDLGQRGEQLLRRIAKDAPEKLMPALEQPGTGPALAAYGGGMLTELTEAYYVEVEDDDDDLRFAIGDDGIRDHSYHAGPPFGSAFRGPFLALLQSDFRGGVRMLNRLLNHATRHRSRTFDGLGLGTDHEHRHELDLRGEPRTYLGDDNVWRWYRGTGSGPYPCISALQALERVCEQPLADGAVTPGELIALLLEDCENLAMPGLAVGLLVRHLERVGDALDPFLAEPEIWDLETTRVVTEGASPGLAADSTGLAHPERRAWSFREVSTLITIRADEERAAGLRAVGERLVGRASQRAGDQDSEYVAMVRIWASALDRTTYQEITENGETYLQSVPPEDAVQTLAAGNADLQRGTQVTALHFKYLTIGNARYAEGPPPDGLEVTADLERVHELLTDPPEQAAIPILDVAVLVASYAVRALAAGELVLEDEWARFAVEIVLRFVEALGPPDPQNADPPSNDMDPDRHAARTLPAMLAAGAAAFRDQTGADAHPRVVAAGFRLAQSAAMEARIQLLQSLDAVWARPCAHDDDCWHRHALHWTVEAMRDCVMGPFTVELGRRATERLGDPPGEALSVVADGDIYVGRLDAAIWALTSAATSGSCIALEARELLLVTLVANRRGTVAHARNYDPFGRHASVAARGLLALVVEGEPEPLWLHVDAYAELPAYLCALLRGLAMFAATDEKTASAARTLWPQIMDRVLGAARGAFADDLSGSSALAALVPRPGEPVGWTDPIGWAPQVDLWIGAATGRPRCIEAFIAFLSVLPNDEQAAFGLPRVARLVGANVAAATELTILDRWLPQIRAAAHEAGEGETWQRLVDALVMAGNSRLSALSD
jgi:hypothetical protein